MYERSLVVWFSLLLVSVVAGKAQAGPAEDYLDAQLRAVAALEAALPAITQAADEAAGRLLSGGKLYLAGEPGMVSELLGRAGGLCGAQPLPPDIASLAVSDVVLLSDYGGAKTSLFERLTKAKAYTVVFVPRGHPWAKGDPKGTLISVPAVYERPEEPVPLVRAVPSLVAAAQWTFVAELVAACRRQGRQPAVYLSIFLDPGRERFKRTQNLMFEPAPPPRLTAQEPLGRQYLAAVRDSLAAIRRDQDQRPTLRAAGGWLREALEAKPGRLFINALGHLPPQELGPLAAHLAGKPTSLMGDDTLAWAGANLRQGDLLLSLGYQENDDRATAAANARGARTIFLTSAGPGAEQAKSPRHIYIDPHWPRTDACVALPGYDVKVCPLSAVANLTCFYAMLAESQSR